jgi:DNA-binding PadR family transcriptional regulator
LAGENADDLRMRWLAMAFKFGFRPDEMDVEFLPGTFSLAGFADGVIKQINESGGAALIVIDTSAAYFEGGDENSNVEVGNHARQLRRFCSCKGGPTVLVLCHPTKNASPDNMLPRGGGAFIAEIDGNLVLRRDGTVLELSWQGKLRGPGFEPVLFETQSTTAPELVDSRGRSLITVVATDLSSDEAEARKRSALRDEDQVLLVLDKLDAPSFTDIARELGWFISKGQPHKSKIHDILKKLQKAGLTDKDRKDKWELTEKGKKEALRLARDTVLETVLTPERQDQETADRSARTIV